MKDGETVNDVLLVSGSDKGIETFRELLGAGANARIVVSRNAGEARRMLIDSDFDLIIINSPLPDEFGHDLALYASDITFAGVILVVKNEIADEISARVEDMGVFVIGKPISRQLFYKFIKLVETSRKRMYGLQKKNKILSGKIDEIKLVNRAKCVLIESLNMTERQAHRYIEKQAMDMRETRKHVAENILKTYQT